MIKLERPDLVLQPGKTAEPYQIAKMPASASFRVQPGDVISLTEVFLKPRLNPVQLKLEDITPEKVEDLHRLIVHKDENIIVLNKPTGLAVHGGPGIEEHLEKFLEAFKFEKTEVPRLVHRLDKDTSGILLLARNRQAASDLASRFKENQLEKSVKKTYWAMLNGVPNVKEGRIVTNIYGAGEERMTSRAENRAGILDEGKVAITRFRNTGIYIRKIDSKRTKMSMLEFEPLTGRTHQLRVHAAEQLGFPIVGDYKYGRHHLVPGAPLHLHARKLVLQDYPEKGKKLTFKAPIPPHFVRTMAKFPLFLRKKPVFPKKKLQNQSPVMSKKGLY